MPRKGNVTRPRTEPMLMIRPSRFWRMDGSTARVTRRSPMTFVSKMTFACSAVKASVTPTDAMPALLTSTSILPASASTLLTPASTDASSLTSNSTVLMPSFRRASAASRFLPCALRIEAYTVWPARNRVSAVSRPKPLLAPVIRIVLDILGLLEGSFDLSFDFFDVIEGGDAKIAESQRSTVLLVVVVIFADDSRLPPSPSDRPTDSDGSSCYAHEFKRPFRMLLVKRIAGDRPFTDRNRQSANFGHHVKRHEKAEQTRCQATSPNQRLRRRVAT